MVDEAIPHAKDFLGEASTQVFINQILMAIVMLNGGKFTVPIGAVDNTSGRIMDMQIDRDAGTLTLVVKKTS